MELKAITLNLSKVDWKIAVGSGQLNVTSDLSATYTASKSASDEKVTITANGPTGVQSQSINLNILASPIVFRDFLVPHKALDGLAIKVLSIIPTPLDDKWKYTVRYELSNPSTNVIAEGKLHMYGPSGLNVVQSGFFGTLLPGENRLRTAEFITTSDRPFEILAYGADITLAKPPVEALLWRVKSLSQVLHGRTFFPVDKGINKYQRIEMFSDTGDGNSSIIGGNYVNLPQYTPYNFPTDSFVLKIDNHNKTEWMKIVHNPDLNTSIRALKTDKLGNIYVIATESKREPFSGEATATLRSYDANGTLRWAKDLGKDGGFQEIAIGNDGNIAVIADAMYLFDKFGTQMWKTPLPFDKKLVFRNYYSLKLADDGSVFIVASYREGVGDTSSTSMPQAYLIKYSRTGILEKQVEIASLNITLADTLQAKTLADGTTAVMLHRNRSADQSSGRVIVEYDSSGQQTNFRDEFLSVVDSQCFGARLQPSDSAEKYFLPVHIRSDWPGSNLATFSFCSRDEKLLKQVVYTLPLQVNDIRIGHVTNSGNVTALGLNELGKSSGFMSFEGFYLNFSFDIDY